MRDIIVKEAGLRARDNTAGAAHVERRRVQQSGDPGGDAASAPCGENAVRRDREPSARAPRRTRASVGQNRRDSTQSRARDRLAIDESSRGLHEWRSAGAQTRHRHSTACNSRPAGRWSSARWSPDVSRASRQSRTRRAPRACARPCSRRPDRSSAAPRPRPLRSRAPPKSAMGMRGGGGGWGGGGGGGHGGGGRRGGSASTAGWGLPT